jgi:hypothetical protein
MIVAIDPNATHEYSLKSDTGDKTVFILGVIDAQTRKYIDDKHLTLSRDGETMKMTEEQIHDKYWSFAKFGLKGWRNFKTPEGEDVPFVSESLTVPGVGQKTVASDSSLNRLSLNSIVEIGMNIVTYTRVSEQDEKNS